MLKLNIFRLIIFTVFIGEASYALTPACANQLARTGITADALRRVVERWPSLASKVSNKAELILIDYSKNSGAERFYLINLDRCEVLATEHVIHGGGYRVYHERGCNVDDKGKRYDRNIDGDPDWDGMLNYCINRNGTSQYMTRPGFVRTAGCHSGQNASWPKLTQACNGVTLVGIEPRTTASYRPGSGIVLHEHNLIPGNMFNGQGCPAMAPGRLRRLLANSERWNGTMVYIYAPQCDRPIASPATNKCRTDGGPQSSANDFDQRSGSSN